MGELIRETAAGLGAIVMYYAVLASLAVLLRRFTRIPKEPFRKLLHCILLGSLFIWTIGFDTWWLSALSALGFAAAVYPLLALLERINGFSSFMTERRAGELKNSLLLVFVMYAAVVTLCWGVMGERMVALCAIYAWGFGDAAAALVGKRFGRHKITGGHIEGSKSAEGTAAMFAVSFMSVLALLILRGGMTWLGCAVTALVTAAVSALVELFSLKGRDTITCPLAAMGVLLPMIHLFGGGL